MLNSTSNVFDSEMMCWTDQLSEKSGKEMVSSHSALYMMPYRTSLLAELQVRIVEI